MKKYLILVVLLAGCTRADHAKETLEAQGYTDVQITGYRFFKCSEDDVTHTGFNAKSPAGHKVSGTVCGGWLLKGSTIRFD
jgi:hypothetical protein